MDFNPYEQFDTAFDLNSEKCNPYKLKIHGVDAPRKTLPSQRVNQIDMEKAAMLIKTIIGKDLSKFSLPVFLNEPTTILQKCAEGMMFADYLIDAAQEPDLCKRMALVATFVAST